MGTRCVITFRDGDEAYSVYQHWDGNPETVIENIRTTRNCWAWPRWEADEFAAAYIATHKTGAGNIRLSVGPDGHGDLSYIYEVTAELVKGKRLLWLTVTDMGDEHGEAETFLIEPPQTVAA